MQFVRKALLVLLAPLFTLLLYATAVDVGFVRVGTHPSTIKSILAKSGIYNTVVPGLLDQSKEISGSGGSVSLSDSLVRTAAGQTFTPQLVQQDTEATIDGVYDWLDGKTPLPDFQIDLTSTKAAFAANVAKLAQQQLQTLPVCSSAASVENFEPLSASCLPPGVTPASAAATLQSTILSGKGFLDNPVITATSIKSGSSSQSVFADQLKNVPNQYQKVKKTPFLLGLVTIVLGLAIIFLSTARAAGLRRIGWPLLVVGIVLLAFAWAINRVTVHNLAPKISVNNAVLQSSLRTLIVDVEQAVDKSYWWFGGGYAALGLGAIGGAMYIKKHNGSKKPAAATEDSAPAEKPPAAPAKPAAPKPRRTIKVQ